MIIAVDTGGTKTLIASFLEDGTIGEEFKFPTPKDTTDYTETLLAALRERFSGQSVDAIVVGIPGMIKDGTAVWCNNLGWSNFDVASALHGALGNAPIFIDNDANLAGLAETRQLDDIPALSLYITVSTGIGSGIITNGTINKALSNSEAGRMQIEYDGATREWETFSSGGAIYRTYNQYARDIKSKRIWNDVADRISRGLLAITPVLQPSVIIIGGSIGTYFEKYDKQLHALLDEKLPAHIPTPKLVQAQHPEQAVIYGCYYYALDCLAAA